MSTASEPPTRPPRRFVGQRQLVDEPGPARTEMPDRGRPQESDEARPATAGLSTNDDEGARAVIRFVARYAAAPPAAAYVGRLQDLSVGEVTLQRGLGSWWVWADLPLNLARELIVLFEGTGYLTAGQRLVPDRGWGHPQTGQRTGARPTGGTVVRSGELSDASVVELVAAAGLRLRPTPPPSSLVVLTPARRAKRLVRRALDLRLETAYRPVRVSPLAPAAVPGIGPDADPGGEPREQGAPAGTLVQITLRASAAREYLPAALVDALEADQVTLPCREAVDGLLVQHGRYSPLTDRQLAALVPTGATWVLADPPIGCWTLEPLAPLDDGWRLITLGPARALMPGGPDWTDLTYAPLPQPQPLRVVRSRSAADAPVDAVLLETSDLDAVRLLLEGHPLAETAVLVPGRDHHLLMAPGGVADRIPVGQYLTCTGPGSIFVAHGWRTDPRLPASAWRDLAHDLGQRALVLQAGRTLVFDLTRRRPVWELWAGEPPLVDVQIPAEARDILAGIDAEELAAAHPSPASRPPSQPVGSQSRDTAGVPAQQESQGLRGLMRRLTGRTSPAPSRPPTWQEQAAAAELAHDLVAAAKLHVQHGDHLRAGRLYERAAYEGATGSAGEDRPS